jgi:hypothetical protein
MRDITELGNRKLSYRPTEITESTNLNGSSLKFWNWKVRGKSGRPSGCGLRAVLLSLSDRTIIVRFVSGVKRHPLVIVRVHP